MGAKRAELEQFFQRRRPREPHWEEVMLKVADAFDAIQETGDIFPVHLQTVVDGASNARALVWMNSVDLLRILSGKWPEAADAIQRMSQNRRANVRFNAICCLGKKTPPRTVDAVLESGLRDKSARVRWKAAQEACQLYRVNLIPAIGAALAAERNAKTRRSIDFSLRLLRDGYRIEKKPDGSVSICVRMQNGFRGKYVSAEGLKRRGIDAIVLEIRKSDV
jgi:hypothetical protein